MHEQLHLVLSPLLRFVLGGQGEEHDGVALVGPCACERRDAARTLAIGGGFRAMAVVRGRAELEPEAPQQVRLLRGRLVDLPDPQLLRPVDEEVPVAPGKERPAAAPDGPSDHRGIDVEGRRRHLQQARRRLHLPHLGGARFERAAGGHGQPPVRVLGPPVSSQYRAVVRQDRHPLGQALGVHPVDPGPPVSRARREHAAARREGCEEDLVQVVPDRRLAPPRGVQRGEAQLFPPRGKTPLAH
mmetsp:Transcript_99521/g.285895  ORF Transcript_99521/g.285895 Transcript_99521/m.285895 type:complete len:243 (+) Transcript_99521:342-1070(+)